MNTAEIGVVDLARLKALIDLVATAQISELEIVEGEEKVRIVKAGVADATPAAASSPKTLPQPIPATQLPTAAPPRPESSKTAVVRAPMFGVFHRTPSPDAPAFVNVGDKISVGQKLCLIEAMKVFNVVESDRSGTVADILVESGREVEAGQALLRIE